ncbi:MAG TPA: hypothetical protein VMW48_07170, partial [Vicinamibacterales bacterium]|nr:hypothetical protein [Vicinamibacterales bacterium]
MFNPDPDSPSAQPPATPPLPAGVQHLDAADDAVVPTGPPRAATMTRGRAIAETVVCSSYPMQIVAAALLAWLGVPA